MLSIKRAEREYGGHWMLTLGTERAGVRVTRGKLDKRGKWHANRPCVFFLWRDRRLA